MKSIIAITLLLALTYGLNLRGEDGLVKFDLEDTESSNGFVMRGHIDPKDELNNKIQTFLKLAGHYIPLLESVGSKNTNLGWTRTFNINLGGLGSISIHGNFDVIVGWKVFVNSGSSNTSNNLDVTYQPFATGFAGAFTSADTYLARGHYNATLFFLRAQAPISLQIFNTAKVCFSGTGIIRPVQLGTQLSASLKGCQAEIFDEIVNSTPLSLVCGFSNALNLTHLNMTFTDQITANVLDHACISF